MRGLLIYFSGTGNTKFIARSIQREFFDKNHFVTIQSIEEHNKINIDIYDFLILGSPKYYEYTPKFFLNWVKDNIPKAKKKLKVISFCTGAAPTATSFKKLESILAKKNCNLVMTKTFEMPNNYLIGIFKSTSKENCKLYTNINLKDVKELVNDFIHDNYKIEKISSFIGFMCKNISSSFCTIAKNKSKNFSVNNNCTSCLKCINNCPVNNITLENGKIIFSDKCILCTRCISLCPNNAIQYNNKIPKQYRYHINELNVK